MTRLYIDADACPVKAEAERVALRHAVPMLLVANGGLRPHPHPLIETVFVPEGADAADKWIAERCGAGDIVVTSDMPLAARCVETGARVLRHDGSSLNTANIGAQLAMRDLMADLRAAAPLAAGGGGKSFGKADRARFLDALDREIRAALRAKQTKV